MTIRRKTTVMGALGFLAALGLGACSAAGPGGQSGESQSGAAVGGETVPVSTIGTPVTIGLTYIPNVQFSPLYVAAHDQIFTAAGVAASLRHHGAEEGLFTALLSGDEHVTIASGDEVLQARQQGADLVSIGAYYHTYPVEILVKDDSPIKALSDLKGKKVGLPGEFGSNWFGLLAALRSAGLQPSDIDVVSVGFTQSASLIAGQVDAVVGFSNSDAVQLEASGTPVRALPLDSEQMPLIGASIVTTKEWLEENPGLATQVVAAITSGADRVIASPQHALEVTETWDPTLSDSGARKGATAVLQATIELLKGPDGRATSEQNLETWKKMAPLLAEILDEPSLTETIEGAVTNNYTDAT